MFPLLELLAQWLSFVLPPGEWDGEGGYGDPNGGTGG
jgi:hypothetical protein